MVHLGKHSPPCLLAFAIFCAFSSTQHSSKRTSQPMQSASLKDLAPTGKIMNSWRLSFSLQNIYTFWRIVGFAARLACQTITSMAATVDDIKGWNWHHLKITRRLLFEFLGWQLAANQLMLSCWGVRISDSKQRPRYPWMRAIYRHLRMPSVGIRRSARQAWQVLVQRPESLGFARNLLQLSKIP